MKYVVLSDRDPKNIIYQTSFVDNNGVEINVLFLDDDDIVVGLNGQYRHMKVSPPLEIEGDLYFSGESTDKKKSTLKFYEGFVVVKVVCDIFYVNSGRKVSVF